MSTRSKAIANLELLSLQETVEGVMTIGEFEAFEVEWLLRAIYADSWLGKLTPSNHTVNTEKKKKKAPAPLIN